MGSSSSQPPTCVRTFNLTNHNAAQSVIYNDVDKFILQVIVPVVSFIGIVGNGAFLYMLIRLPKMRSSLSLYLAALAICDIMFLAISNLLYAITLIKTDIIYGWPANSSIGCGVGVVLSHVWYYASVGLVTLISLERYFAICHPIKHRLFQGKARNAKLIGIMLIASLAVTTSTVPRYTYYHSYCLIWPDSPEYRDREPFVTTCGTWSRYYNSYEGFLLVAVFISSALCNCVFYTNILLALGKSKKLLQDDAQSDDRHTRVRNQVARTLILNGVVFFICQIPYRIDNLDDAFDFLRVDFDLLTNEQEATVTTIGQAFLFLNSVVNPFIYVFSSAHYRQGMIEVFWCKKKPMTRFAMSTLSTKVPTSSSTSADVTVN